MVKFTVVAIAVTLLGLSSAPSSAAVAKRSFQECESLAFQRGFRNGNGNENRSRRAFIRGCERGKFN